MVVHRGGPERGSSPSPLLVAVVTHVFAPSVGGAEAYHEQGAIALARLVDVVILTADTMLRDGSPMSTPLEVRYLRSHRLLGENLIEPPVLMKELRRHRVSLVWTNHPSITADIAGVFARASRIRWVATYHGDLMATKWYARAYTFWEMRLLRRASRVIVHAEAYRARLIERGLAPDRVVAVTPGPGIGRGGPPPDQGPRWGPATPPGPEHPFLFVGGIDTARAYKRPERLLHAIRDLKDEGLTVHAWIVGDGDRRAALEGLAAQLGVADRVAFLGRLSDAELAQRYRASWALVLPSNSTEGFGLVTIEAIQFGCPVVISEGVPSGPLLAGLGCALVYPEEDPRALSRTLASLWTAPDLRHRMSERALAAAPRFMWETAEPALVAAVLSGLDGLPSNDLARPPLGPRPPEERRA